MLENGNVATQKGTLVGSKVTYSCNSNYTFTIDSSMERTCKSSGSWSDETIECGECGKKKCLVSYNKYYYPCWLLWLIKIKVTYINGVVDMEEIVHLSKNTNTIFTASL